MRDALNNLSTDDAKGSMAACAAAAAAADGSSGAVKKPSKAQRRRVCIISKRKHDTVTLMVKCFCGSPLFSYYLLGQESH